MIRAGNFGNKRFSAVRVPAGVKIKSRTYCQFLKSVFQPWLEEIPLSLMLNLIYMHDDVPSHAAKALTQYLECFGFKNQTLMIWPPNSPDLSPVENL